MAANMLEGILTAIEEAANRAGLDESMIEALMLEANDLVPASIVDVDEKSAPVEDEEMGMEYDDSMDEPMDEPMSTEDAYSDFAREKKGEF